MPELPEVETTRRELEPRLVGRRVERVVVREPRLRWPVPPELAARLEGRRISGLARRAKYLLASACEGGGTALIHLGMSGSLRLTSSGDPAGRHDHVDWRFDDGQCLRYHDPRRFGAMLWWEGAPARHPLLSRLGPEPFTDAFHGGWLHERSRGRRAAVKSFLMDGRIVAGVGNIYANEALFEAGIHPARPAGRISRERYERLADAVRRILSRSIGAGGTSFRDYVHTDGGLGRYQNRVMAYDRAGEPGIRCGASLRGRPIGQRSTVWCPRCQR